MIAAGVASAVLGVTSLREQSGPAAAAPRVLRIAGRDLESGRPLDPTLRGRAVVVEFWSTACPECRRESARLRRLTASDPSAVLVGIDVGDPPASARMLLRRFGWHEFSLADPDASYAHAVSVRALPTTLVLNQDHRIISQTIGVDSLTTLERPLKQA